MHTNRHSPQSEGGAFVGLDWDLGRNPAKQALIAHELDGYANGRIAGQRHYDVLPDVPERWREIHRRVLAGESIAADNDRILRADGRYDSIRWQMAPWRRQDGSIGGALLFAEVVTE